MIKPLVSIIVPVYNVEKYLDKCVQSLKSQTLKEIEIILVDDGSPDTCPEMCDEYAKIDSRIKVIHKKNGGLSSARNAGLELISGEYYMFVDSDDWLDLETCEYAYKYANDYHADCLMFSYTKEFENQSITNHIFDKEFLVYDKEQIIKHFHRRLFGLIDEELKKPQDADLIVSACMQLFKSNKFKSIRFVDTQKIGTEDCWYQILLYEACEKFLYLDKPFYHYLRTNDGSLTTKYNPNLFTRWQKMFDYMQSYIFEHNKGQEYQKALNNRIALSILGAGLNQTHSDDNLIKGSNSLKRMLNTERYSVALSQLDTYNMPVSWKMFFFLAKHKLTMLLFAMLKTIEYLRTHKK